MQSASSGGWAKSRVFGRGAIVLACAVAPLYAPVGQLNQTAAQEPAVSPKSQTRTSGREAPPASAVQLEADREKFWADSNRLRDEGKLAEAIAAAEKVLAIERQWLGEDHEDVVGSIEWIARLWEEAEDWPKAKTRRLEALAWHERRHGADHWQTSDARRALDHWQRLQSLTAHQRARLRRAEAANREVMQLLNAGRAAAAIELATNAAADFKEVLGKEHAGYATMINNLAVAYENIGNFARSESLHQQALTIRQKALGERHPDYVQGLANLALLYHRTGDFPRAEKLFSQALAGNKQLVGENHSDTATILNNFALLYDSMGDYARSLDLLQQTLEIRKRTDGTQHADYARALNNLGAYHHKMGDYARAEPLFRQASEIWKATVGQSHPSYVASLNNLSGLYRDMGDYARAESLARQASDLWKQILGEAHPDYAHSLHNLALIYHTRGEYRRAEPLYRQTLAIWKATVGEEHPLYAAALDNLAMAYYRLDDADQADSLFRQALNIRKKSLGENHPDYATSLHNLALHSHAMGDAARGELLIRQAVELRKKVLGDHHPDYATSLSMLAMLDAAKGNSAAALDGLVQVNDTRQRALENVFSISSESRMRAYLATMSKDLDALLTLPLAELGRADDGLAWLLRRKAIVFEALCRFRAAQWVAAGDPEFAKRQLARESAQRRLDDVTLRPPAGMPADELANRRQAIQDEIGQLDDRLRADLSQRLGKTASLMAEVDEVRARLPMGDALVELAKFTPLDFRSTSEQDQWGAERYVAFVLLADPRRPVEIIDLGEAAPIDELVGQLRECVENAKRNGEFADWADLESQYIEPAQALHQRLWAPIAAKLGGVTRIYLSPDSELHNLPFEALVDADGRYLLEADYSFAYLASGRDLLRGGEDRPGGGAFVFSAPNYDLGHEARFALARNDAAQLIAGSDADDPANANLIAASGFRGTRSADVRGLKWQVLPGMGPEGAEAAAELDGAVYDKVETYSGDRALEERFKRLVRPRLVVLISHGYFLPDQPAERGIDDPTSRGAFAQGAGLARLRAQENPLYRSGVVLAGANTLDDPVPDGTIVEDGWLTAEEISQLDLRGTDLVVLSACNTSRGQVATGDAVAGLRSAFMFAGARTLVGSLFEVPDAETRALMRDFYAALGDDQPTTADASPASRGKLAALNRAKLAQINRLRAEHAGAAHPFFWASFVLVGAP